MPTEEQVQKLIEARSKHIRQASEARSVDGLLVWYASDAILSDVVNHRTMQGWDAIRDFYSVAYKAVPQFWWFRLNHSKITGFTPEFMALEMRCEGQVAANLPHLGMNPGDTLLLTGVSLFWWRWEGPGTAWDGSLSEEALRGWKITEERVYITTTKKEAK